MNFIGSWTNSEAAAPSDGREQLRTGERAGQDDMKCTVSSTSLVAVPSDATHAQCGSYRGQPTKRWPRIGAERRMASEPATGGSQAVRAHG